MFTTILATLVVLVVAVAAIGVVAVGQQKLFVDRVPRFARDAAMAVRHLDGRAVRPPARVDAAFRSGLLITAHLLRRLVRGRTHQSA